MKRTAAMKTRTKRELGAGARTPRLIGAATCPVGATGERSGAESNLGTQPAVTPTHPAYPGRSRVKRSRNPRKHAKSRLITHSHSSLAATNSPHEPESVLYSNPASAVPSAGILCPLAFLLFLRKYLKCHLMPFCAPYRDEISSPSKSGFGPSASRLGPRHPAEHPRVSCVSTFFSLSFFGFGVAKLTAPCPPLRSELKKRRVRP